MSIMLDEESYKETEWMQKESGNVLLVLAVLSWSTYRNKDEAVIQFQSHVKFVWKSFMAGQQYNVVINPIRCRDS
jgi:hypothetical protein